MSRYRTVSARGTRPAPWRRGVAVPAGRLRGFAAAAGVLILLAGCAAGQEEASQQERNPYTAVSPSEEEPEQTSAQEPVEEGIAPDEDEMAEILLTEEEFPSAPEGVEEFRGTDYFHEHIGTASDTYVQNFGQQACAQQMDTINERLVGEEPVDGMLREASWPGEDGQSSVFVWMLSYEEVPERGPLWDEVLQACEDTVLQDGEDRVSFSSFSQDGFRGMELEMTVDDGSEIRQMDGFSATLEHGKTLLMVSAVSVDHEDFEAVVRAQAEKLAAYDAG